MTHHGIEGEEAATGQRRGKIKNGVNSLLLLVGEV